MYTNSEKSCSRKHFQCKCMYTQLQNGSDSNLIRYGYSVYLLNLLVEDLNIPNIKKQMFFIT